MRDSNNPIRIKARWDHNKVPTGKSNQRGLLLEIEADKPESIKRKKRPSLNLAIVIDRSGSMHNGRLEAAKEAAIGIVNRLSWHDHLSVVVYDDHVNVLVDGQRQDRKTRPKTEEIIQSIHTGGCTNLADGWLRGARCVADVMDREDMKNGHVILLSDGMANCGETEPEALSKLAGDLAMRGVTSSCVGIGHNYSPLQLNAIAEAGEGEMHHSNEPEEIVEVVMGELGEATRLVARNFSVTLQLPYAIQSRQLTRYRTRSVDGHFEYYLGNLVGGQQRRLAFLVELPEIADPQTLKLTATANWLDVDTAMEEHSFQKDIELQVVPAHSYDKHERNKEVARIIADIWMARHGYDAMMLNEQGLYEEAAKVFDYDEERFAKLTAGLEEAREMRMMREKQRANSASAWRGEAKLEAMSMSRKAMRSKPDFRRKRRESKWTDFNPDS